MQKINIYANPNLNWGTLINQKNNVTKLRKKIKKNFLL